jgi:mycothiol synthase
MSAGSEPLEVQRRGTVGHAHRERHGWEVELTAGTGRLDVTACGALLDALVEEIAARGGGRVTWRVPVATPEHHRAASTAGFDGTRRIVQMRRPLPAPWTSTIDVRTFRPGVDDDEWLRVNNAAFDWHPEQGGWDRDALHERTRSDWFDPTGFLLHPADGPLDGFCWTKVHHELDPPAGEIFVIGVHPDAAGRGLGRELVLAGLDHLTARGLTSVLLYTEADNAPARALYDRLGFTVHHEVTVFARTVDSDVSASGTRAHQ